jgi:hypothetical protein
MPSLPVILFIVFLVLKLTHNIHWSWLWVTSPLWIAAATGVAVVATGGAVWNWTRNRL